MLVSWVPWLSLMVVLEWCGVVCVTTAEIYLHNGYQAALRLGQLQPQLVLVCRTPTTLCRNITEVMMMM